MIFSRNTPDPFTTGHWARAREHMEASMRLVLIVLALCGVCATAQATEPAGFVGTASAGCGPTDEVFTAIEVTSSQGGAASIFVVGTVPADLDGPMPINGGGHPEPSAQLSYCPGAGKPCVLATDGTIIFSRGSPDAVGGRIQFRVDGSSHPEITFAAEVVEPRPHPVCG